MTTPTRPIAAFLILMVPAGAQVPSTRYRAPGQQGSPEILMQQDGSLFVRSVELTGEFQARGTLIAAFDASGFPRGALSLPAESAVASDGLGHCYSGTRAPSGQVRLMRLGPACQVQWERQVEVNFAFGDPVLFADEDGVTFVQDQVLYSTQNYATRVGRLDEEGDLVWQVWMPGALKPTRLPGGDLLLLGEAANVLATTPTTGLDVIACRLARDGTIRWQTALGGSGEDQAFRATPTADGGVLVAGYQAADVWFAKLDDAGQVTWQAIFDAGGAISPLVALENAGPNGIWVLGTAQVSAAPAWALVLVHLDPEGELLTAGRYGNSASLWGNHLAVEPGGRCLVLGLRFPFGTWPTGSADVYTLCVDPDGDVVWSRRLYKHAFEYPYAAFPTSDRGFVVIGHSGGHSFVAKLRANTGKPQWMRGGKTGLAPHFFQALDRRADGQSLIAMLRLDFEVDHGHLDLQQDLILLDVDPAGQLVSTRRLDEAVFADSDGYLDVPLAIARDPSGTPLLAGQITAHNDPDEVDSDLWLASTSSVGCLQAGVSLGKKPLKSKAVSGVVRTDLAPGTAALLPGRSVAVVGPLDSPVTVPAALSEAAFLQLSAFCGF